MKALFAGVVATLSLVLVLGVNQAGEKDKKDVKDKVDKKDDGKGEPKYKIKEVMSEVMKNKLGPKVFAGQGTKEENKKVLDYFIALHENAPPKGEKESWAKITQALVDAAKKIESGEEKGGKKLAALINCGACHKEFKAK